MSMVIRFVRIRKSELITEAIEDRVMPVLQKFNLSKQNDIYFEVEMENSPHQVGRDLYRLKLNVRKGEMRGFILEKSDINFYRALSALVDSLPVNIKRFGGKKTKENINKLRRLKNAANY